MGRIISVAILSLFHLIIISSLSAQADQIEHVGRVDQEQTGIDYGFWFDNDVIRWQEFVPTIDNLTAVEVFIQKSGSPGNLIAEIRDLAGNTLISSTVAESSAPSYNWIKISFSSSIYLIPGSKYRIYIRSDQDSPDANNRYSWRGSNSSTYNTQCQNDVSGSWPNFDYAFRTYGLTTVSSIEEQNIREQNTIELFLGQNYPNPFNSKTRIDYKVRKAGNVEISIFNYLGQKVASLVNEIKPVGNYSITWDAQEFPSGTYIYKIGTADGTLIKKMVLTK